VTLTTGQQALQERDDRREIERTMTVVVKMNGVIVFLNMVRENARDFQEL
jgi:hypothetical protein